MFPLLFIALIAAPLLSGIGVSSSTPLLFYISIPIQFINLIGFLYIYINIVDMGVIPVFLLLLLPISVIVTIVLGALYNLPLLISSCVVGVIALFWVMKERLLLGIKYAYENPKPILIGLGWASLVIMMLGSGLFFIVQCALGNKVEFPGLLWAGSSALLLIAIILYYYRNLVHISAEKCSMDPKPIYYYNFMSIINGLICLTGLIALIVTLVLKIKWTLWYGIAIYGLSMLSFLIRWLMKRFTSLDESLNTDDKMIGDLFLGLIPGASVMVSPALLIIAGTQFKMEAIFWTGIGIYSAIVGAALLSVFLYFLIKYFRNTITILLLLTINISAVLCIVTKMYPSFPYPYVWIIGTAIFSTEGAVIIIGSILWCFRDVFLIPVASTDNVEV